MSHPPWPPPRDRPPRSGVARRSSSSPASTATSRPAPKRCWSRRSSWPKAASSASSSSSTSTCCRAPIPTARPSASALRPTASTSIAITCCCAPRKRRPSRAGARPRAAGGARPARVPGRRGAVEQPFAQCSASTCCCSTRHRQHAALRHQGSRGMVPRAAGRRPRCRRLQQRLVSHGLADPADRRVSMGSAAPQIGRNAHGLTNAVSLLVETRAAASAAPISSAGSRPSSRR